MLSLLQLPDLLTKLVAGHDSRVDRAFLASGSHSGSDEKTYIKRFPQPKGFRSNLCPTHRRSEIRLVQLPGLLRQGVEDHKEMLLPLQGEASHGAFPVVFLWFLVIFCLYGLLGGFQFKGSFLGFFDGSWEL